MSAIVIFYLSVTVYEIFTVKILHDLDFDLKNGPRSNVNTPIESQQATSYMLAIVIFSLSVTVCEITTFNLPKWSQFESFTFKK